MESNLKQQFEPMKPLRELKEAAGAFMMVNTPYDLERALGLAEQLAMLTDWAERAAAILEHVVEWDGADGAEAKRLLKELKSNGKR